MRAVILVAYLVMALWLLVSASLRIVILLGSEQGLDPLPFVSAALAIVALIFLRPLLRQRPKAP